MTNNWNLLSQMGDMECVMTGVSKRCLPNLTVQKRSRSAGPFVHAEEQQEEEHHHQHQHRRDCQSVSALLRAKRRRGDEKGESDAPSLRFLVLGSVMSRPP